eukprot:gene1811-33230_t
MATGLWSLVPEAPPPAPLLGHSLTLFKGGPDCADAGCLVLIGVPSFCKEGGGLRPPSTSGEQEDGDTLVVAGGMDRQYAVSNKVFQLEYNYNISHYTWARMPNLLDPTLGHSATYSATYAATSLATYSRTAAPNRPEPPPSADSLLIQATLNPVVHSLGAPAQTGAPMEACSN